MTGRNGRVYSSALFCFATLIAFIATAGCRQGEPRPAPIQTDLSTIDTLELAVSDSALVRDDTIRYMPYPIDGAAALKALQDSLGEEKMALVLKLNRIDLRHARRGDTLVVADSLADLLAVSPFPHKLEAAWFLPKFLLVSRRVQAFAAYEAGRLVYWGPTSTGKRSTPTPAALYFANWRMKSRRSTINRDWLLEWYVNLENFEGISFHKYALPGYPASHACVRLTEEDARWIYDWATLWILSRDQNSVLAEGTPVIVFGDYAYGQTPPWKEVTEDPLAATLTMEEIDALFAEHLPALQAAVEARYAYLDSLSRHQIGVPF